MVAEALLTVADEAEGDRFAQAVTALAVEDEGLLVDRQRGGGPCFGVELPGSGQGVVGRRGRIGRPGCRDEKPPRAPAW